MTAIATTQGRSYGGARRAPVLPARPARVTRTAPVLCRRRPNVMLRRRIAGLIVVALVALTVSGLWAMRSEAAPEGALVEATVVVGPGDTVWELAKPYTPAGEHPQAYVAEVLRYNDLDAAAVLPGTVLRLPR